MDNITHQEVRQQKILVNASHLQKNMDVLLLERLKDTVGNKCLEGGYIKRNSIEVIRRSLGMYEAEKLKGDFSYIIEYKADVILPTEDCILEGKIISKNKMGLYVNVGENNEIRILLPKEYHINNEEYENKKVGEQIRCKIAVADFNMGSAFINCVGLL